MSDNLERMAGEYKSPLELLDLTPELDEDDWIPAIGRVAPD